MSEQPQDQQDWYDSPLYKLLCERFPKHVKTGRLNVLELAAALDYSYENIYKWLRAGRINPKNAKRIVENSKTATMEELMPFILA